MIWFNSIQVLEVLTILSRQNHALSGDLGTLPLENNRDGMKIREIFTRESVDGQVQFLFLGWTC